MGGLRPRLVFAAAAVIASGAVAAVALAGSSRAAKPLPLRLVPNTMTFLDASHGALGTGWRWASGHGGGTIALTSDGGRSWHVVELTPRPVVSLTIYGGTYLATYDDGETLRSSRDGLTWRPTTLNTSDISTEFSVCPQGMTVGINADSSNWSLCTTESSAGSQGKAVYRDLPARGWVLVACTNFATAHSGCGKHSYGGISSYGYPLGIAGDSYGASNGFGLIWESRGTLYVTRDGGHHWTALDKLVKPELDFGSWAYTLPSGYGWALVGHGGGPWRLLRTKDSARTWDVVHRWTAPKPSS